MSIEKYPKRIFNHGGHGVSRRKRTKSNQNPLFLRELRVYIFLLFFLLPVCFLHAQDGETRFIQRLTWTGDEYTRRYEVVIEKEEAGRYRGLRQETTSELFIDVPLLPGKYRCHVIPYNFLDMAGVASPWMYIEVVAALNPELDMLPGFILSETKSGTALYEMPVSGRNLIPGAEIFLQGPGGRIVPVETQSAGDGTHVRLFFAKDQLIAGDYELMVINPGGLRASRSGITFPPAEPVDITDDAKSVQLAEKKADIFFSAAWMPSFAIYDDENRFFGQDISLAGAAVRFGVVTTGSYFDFNPGLELAASYSFMGSGRQAHLWGVGLNLLVMKRLPGDKMALSFRLGAGYSVHFQANMGVSFLLFVMDRRNKFRLYLETGIDYAHWFTDTNPDLHPSSFRPWLGVGFSF
jgi:hypothetical protein